MDWVKEKVYERLFDEYKDKSDLDPLSIKYIFETWKMTKEMYEQFKEYK